jgi:hypothetical protein
MFAVEEYFTLKQTKFLVSLVDSENQMYVFQLYNLNSDAFKKFQPENSMSLSS